MCSADKTNLFRQYEFSLSASTESSNFVGKKKDVCFILCNSISKSNYTETSVGARVFLAKRDTVEGDKSIFLQLTVIF